jgi:hypothetical protein
MQDLPDANDSVRMPIENQISTPGEQHCIIARCGGAKSFHLCKWRCIGDVPFQYRERGLGGPPMLGSPLAPAGGTELLAHLHRWKSF